MANTTTGMERCACGCGQWTDRTVMMLREQDRGTAEALGWAEMSIAPMRVAVHVVDGHEEDGIDGYVDERVDAEADADEVEMADVLLHEGRTTARGRDAESTLRHTHGWIDQDVADVLRQRSKR